jgi:hypothetical protein
MADGGATRGAFFAIVAVEVLVAVTDLGVLVIPAVAVVVVSELNDCRIVVDVVVDAEELLACGEADHDDVDSECGAVGNRDAGIYSADRVGGVARGICVDGDCSNCAGGRCRRGRGPGR